MAVMSSGFLLTLLSVTLSLTRGLGEEQYLLPAAQVLSFLSEAGWREGPTLSLLRAVTGRVRSEYRLQGSRQGFSRDMVDFLKRTSELTAKHQLQAIVDKILDNKELNLPGSRALLQKFREELKDPNAQLNKVLTHALPLIYN